MNPTLTYFTQQGRISDPGPLGSLYASLPTSAAELVKVVQNVTLHVFWAERYGYKVSAERTAELQLRTIPRRLERTLELDPRPLLEQRSLDQKLIGNCRDHSVLLTSLLRHAGIPARARCGFATYFQPNHFEDHWVAEYWDETAARWVLVDPQLDAFQSSALQINFNPLDVPRDQFLVGGHAWQLCRSGQENPDHFGIFDMRGLGFVRGNLVRDLASLNKVELLPWDCWGVILSRNVDDPADLAALDAAAALTAGDVPDADAVRQCYQTDARFRVENPILSYVNGQMLPVELPPVQE